MTVSRNPTRAVEVGSITIGGGHPIAIQSMTATPTQDVQATAALVNHLAEAGADLKGLSDAVTGDDQKHVVRWDGEDDLGNCAGQEVILEFKIKDAALYSLDFTPDA